MKLKDFIVTVLVDINEGIKEAHQKTGKDIHLKVATDSQSHGVNFDVAVTTTTSKENKQEVTIINLEQSRIAFTIVSSFTSKSTE